MLKFASVENVQRLAQHGNPHDLNAALTELLAKSGIDSHNLSWSEWMFSTMESSVCKHICILQSRLGCMRVLLQHGADPNAMWKGLSMIEYAMIGIRCLLGEYHSVLITNKNVLFDLFQRIDVHHQKVKCLLDAGCCISKKVFRDCMVMDNIRAYTAPCTRTLHAIMNQHIEGIQNEKCALLLILMSRQRSKTYIGKDVAYTIAEFLFHAEDLAPPFLETVKEKVWIL